MSDKCTHNTTIVEYDGGNVQVERCTWGCGQTLVSYKKANGTTVTMTYQELAALRERVRQLEWVVKRLEHIGDEHLTDEELCPICRAEKPSHWEDCELAAALRGEE